MNIPFLSYLACVSHIGPIYLGIKRYQVLNRPMWIFFYLCSAILVEYIIELVFALQRMNNLKIVNFGMAMETIGIGIFYYTALRKNVFRSLQIVNIGVYAVLLIGSMSYAQRPDHIDSFAGFIGKTAIIIGGILYLVQEFTSSTQELHANPVFWVAIGSLLYNVGTIVIFGMAEIIFNGISDYIRNAWYINFFLIIVANMFYMKAFSCKTQ